METENKVFIVYSRKCINKLIDKGFGKDFIRVEADKKDPDHKKSVFILKDSEELQAAMVDVKDELAKEREEREASSNGVVSDLQKQIEALQLQVASLSQPNIDVIREELVQ